MGKFIKIAASNSEEQDKISADIVCTGEHDERVINRQIALLEKGGTIQLLDGDYYIDSFENEGNSAIYFGYNNGNARVINFIGDSENKAYNTRFGVTLHVTERAMKSIPENEIARVFFGSDQKPDAPGDFFTYTFVNNVNFRNFYLYLFDASYPVTGVDLENFGASEISQVGIFTEKYFGDRFLHLKPSAPHPKSVGIRTCRHSNDEMARMGIDNTDVGGVYTGYEFVGADHMILRNCFAARCCYGFVFNTCHKTTTLINCADEGNRYLPRFNGSGTITAIDFCIERFNSDFIPDDVDEEKCHLATESEPGSWHGFISYTLQGDAFGIKRFWQKGHGENFETVNIKHSRISRPENPEFRESYFDKLTNRTYTWNGDNWIDNYGNIAE